VRGEITAVDLSASPLGIGKVAVGIALVTVAVGIALVTVAVGIALFAVGIALVAEEEGKVVTSFDFTLSDACNFNVA
jgi:hypothetical protein